MTPTLSTFSVPRIKLLSRWEVPNFKLCLITERYCYKLGILVGNL